MRRVDDADRWHGADATTRKVVVEIADRDDGASAGYHQIKHLIPDWVTAQTFTSAGEHVPLPGAGRTWKQLAGEGKGVVCIPQLNDRSYPLTVVIVG